MARGGLRDKRCYCRSKCSGDDLDDDHAAAATRTGARQHIRRGGLGGLLIARLFLARRHGKQLARPSDHGSAVAIGEEAKASFDAWHTPFTAGDDGQFEPLNDEDFQLCFTAYQRCDSGSIYWDELASLWQDGYSLLVYQQIYELPKFGKEMRAAQARFAEIAPDGVLFDAVKFVPWYSSRSISFLIAVQPRRADALVPRWKALPQKMGEGASEWDGFMSFQDQARWHHKSALAWTEEQRSDAAGR